MDFHRQIALVTGANRGLGAHLVAALLAAGVTRVYAAARSPERIAAHVVADPRVVAVQLDVTDEASVQAAAGVASDVTLLVNNAGSLAFGGIVDGDLDGARQDLETNY